MAGAQEVVGQVRELGVDRRAGRLEVVEVVVAAVVVVVVDVDEIGLGRIIGTVRLQS